MFPEEARTEYPHHVSTYRGQCRRPSQMLGGTNRCWPPCSHGIQSVSCQRRTPTSGRIPDPPPYLSCSKQIHAVRSATCTTSPGSTTTVCKRCANLSTFASRSTSPPPTICCFLADRRDKSSPLSPTSSNQGWN